uniref:complement receptor type 1-like isoform X2 n=1 Tax=Ciona intestinalis TaxID=7719 RepID=UPI000521B58A|nr:complement receptor type 1-like isoform X2 [Ciona intestinalis]|eukprot:XP_009862367.1 complement receptor type 1-like isoform X2 [Ciona intestinalis]
MSSLIWIAIVGVIYIHFASSQVCSPSVPRLSNGGFRCRYMGRTCMAGNYYCNTGYKLQGRVYDACFHGRWLSRRDTRCVEVCTPIFPMRPSNGGFSCRYVNNACMSGTYFCDHGYKLRGINYNVCFNRQGWLFESPSCVKDGCDPPTYRGQKRISNGTYMPVQETYNTSSVITVTCNTGYKPRNRNSYCTHYESQYYWSPSIACDGEVKCNPPTLAHANYSPRESNYSVNSTITVKCIPGFMLRGTPQSYCRGDRFFTYWSPTPTCTRIRCSSPPRLTNGYRTPSWSYFWRVNSTVTYECNSGFKLIGENSSSCQECEDTSGCIGGGQWDNVVPTCIRKVACDPPSVRNGNYSPHRSEYNSNSAITITCNAGYTARDQRSRCAEYLGYSWSPDPVCERAVSCDPPTVLNGYHYGRRQRYNRNSVITVYCDIGYFPSRTRITCQRTPSLVYYWDPSPNCTQSVIEEVTTSGGDA